MSSIHMYSDVLYCLGDDGKLYKLLSQEEYAHYYTPRLIPDRVTDLASHSAAWYWHPIRYFYGLDISKMQVQSVIVLHGKFPLLYLTTPGVIYRWYKEDWKCVSRVLLHGYYLDRERDSIAMRDGRDGVVVRLGRGAKGCIGSGGRVLYTLDGDWLVSTDGGLGNVSMRIDDAWVELIMIEDGRIVAISSGKTLALPS